jgi:hypothetical protein
MYIVSTRMRKEDMELQGMYIETVYTSVRIATLQAYLSTLH